MDENIAPALVSVRADTGAFARDVAAMTAELDGPFAAGAERAGRGLETALTRALRTGRLGFDDLRRVAVATMAEIASAAIRGGIGALLGGGPAGSIGVLLGALIGAPGKAIGGPVTPGRPYLVGERGPELFVPTAAGRIDAAGRGGARDVRLSITVNAGQAGAPEALKASSRQVARAVRRALIDAGD